MAGRGHAPGSWLTEERLEREGKAVAAVTSGAMTQQRAAEFFDVPKSTLSDRLQWFGEAGVEEKRREAEEHLLNVTMTTAILAQREIAKRLAEDPGALTIKELVPVAGMSQDKIAVQRGWGKGGHGEGASANALAEALAQMGGGSVTITVNRRTEAIEAEVLSDAVNLDGDGG